jgi:hypothetical protein
MDWMTGVLIWIQEFDPIVANKSWQALWFLCVSCPCTEKYMQIHTQEISFNEKNELSLDFGCKDTSLNDLKFLFNFSW